MKTKLLLFLGFILILSFSSCDKDINNPIIEEEPEFVPRKDDNLQLKTQFGKALAKVFVEFPETREIIKREALKKINHDYDVIYELIKDEVVADGITFRECILKFIPLEDLNAIEENLPTLTIFVPTLPMESFSAEKWNTDTEIPVVAIRTHQSNDVPVYDSKGEETVIEARYIPGYPIVVVKENERIMEALDTRSINSSQLLTRSGTGKTLAFIDDVFNNLEKKESQSSNLKMEEVDLSTRATPVIPENFQKFFDAYDIYKNYDGWHRDYVYYNQTPTQTTGKLDRKYTECLVAFEMVGDAKAALNKISDQTDDPRLGNKWIEKKKQIRPNTWGVWYTPWTDGEFEFMLKIYIGSKHPTGTELIKYLRAKPEDLFDAVPAQENQKNGNTFYLKELKLWRFYLDEPLPLFDWDLDNISSSIKIAIEEVDAKGSQKTAVETSLEFATNFSYEASFGDRVKKGLKFGASNKEIRKTSFDVTTTIGNDELGEVIINFGDNIILNKESYYTPTGRSTKMTPNYNDRYNTGWCRVFVAPVKMY